MAGAYDNPADLAKTTEAAKTAAVETSQDSYTVTIDMPLVANKKYKFQAAYNFKDPETGLVSEGPRSPWIEDTFVIPNKTLPVTNLVLTSGIKGYGVKFNTDPLSEHEDIIVYESLTGVFAGEEYIVWVGTSNSLFINTDNFTPRWVKVVTRDKWLDINRSSATAGPVTPQNADPDTSTPPSAPSSVSVVGSIDANDKSGFSGKLTASWSANTDTNTSGYILRWTTQNPASTPNPLWEYGQVDGKATTTFDITGLIPNTLYYWQVTAKSPYNALTWIGSQSGTVGPIVDANAPADAFAQIRSILSIGGKTADLFKIGTGIAQSINTSTTITPSQTAGTYSGIILNKSTTNFGHNYWLNTGQFRVGSSSAFLFWDGSDLYTTGKINATGGSFSGDVQLSGGSLYAGASPSTGARVRLNSSGLFAYDANNNQTISISQVDGKVDARKGYIGGWTIDGTAQTTGSIYSTNTKLESNGTLTLGDTTGTLASIVRLSATDTFRIWVGSQSSSNAAFKVDSNGKLYATGAVFGSGTSVAGYATSGELSAVSGTATSASTAAQTAATDANTAKIAAAAAKATADAALPKTSFDRAAIVKAINNTTNTTTIDGGILTTGTVSANAVVADFISVFSLNADKITAGTLTGRDIDIAGDSYSNRFRTSYNRNTPVSGSTVSSLGINAIAMISANTSGVVSHWYPYLAAESDLGLSTYYWRNVRYSGSLLNVSDQRLKTGIVDSDLGLDFINLLRPVKYRKKYTPEVPFQNDEGQPILDENNNRVIDTSYNYEGSRMHYGLIAQEVKAALDQVGVGDNFSGWALSDVENEDSIQNLAYDKFISPMIKSIQELSDMVESLQQEVNTLKGI